MEVVENGQVVVGNARVAVAAGAIIPVVVAREGEAVEVVAENKQVVVAVGEEGVVEVSKLVEVEEGSKLEVVEAKEMAVAGGGGVGKEGTKGEHLKELQSTGRDKNELHCPADLCSGLPGKQFLLSSKSAKPKHAGGSPVKKLYENVKFSRFGSLQILAGILPESIL
ncbi:unnamed protein product, partial [Vitis vinifera]